MRATGAPFELIRIPLDGEEFARRIGDYSPSRTVPALQHGGLTLWDSLAICEYLADQFPAVQLWPQDRGLRALGRSISCEMHAGLPALRREFPFNCRARGRRVQASEAAARDIARAQQWIGACRQASPGAGWLLGGFSILDCMLIPVLLRFHSYGLVVDEAASGYLAQVLRAPQVAEWMDLAAAETEVLPHEEIGQVDD